MLLLQLIQTVATTFEVISLFGNAKSQARIVQGVLILGLFPSLLFAVLLGITPTFLTSNSIIPFLVIGPVVLSKDKLIDKSRLKAGCEAVFPLVKNYLITKRYIQDCNRLSFVGAFVITFLGYCGGFLGILMMYQRDISIQRSVNVALRRNIFQWTILSLLLPLLSKFLLNEDVLCAAVLLTMIQGALKSPVRSIINEK